MIRIEYSYLFSQGCDKYICSKASKRILEIKELNIDIQSIFTSDDFNNADWSHYKFLKVDNLINKYKRISINNTLSQYS